MEGSWDLKFNKNRSNREVEKQRKDRYTQRSLRKLGRILKLEGVARRWVEDFGKGKNKSFGRMGCRKILTPKLPHASYQILLLRCICVWACVCVCVCVCVSM